MILRNLLKGLQQYSIDVKEDDSQNESTNNDKEHKQDEQTCGDQSKDTDVHKCDPIIGIGLDSAMIPLRSGSLFLVQTTDFLYPLIDDPYMMGKIACANVLSDLYAMGVTECDNMLMLVGVSTQMSESDQDCIYNIMMNGFKDAANEAGSLVGGGETNFNPWCVIGGTATAVCKSDEVIVPENAQVGDVLVLTKPLGTQTATFVYPWLQDEEKWKQVESVITRDQITAAFNQAVDSMARLNKIAAGLMKVHKAHAATDVTGFGLLGHAENLAKHQKNKVTFSFHTLPVFAHMPAVNDAVNNKFKLLDGKGIETSGGLLISFSMDDAKKFCQAINEIEGYNAWIVGDVKEGDGDAELVESFRVIEVPPQENYS